jgi:hypothetical protein
MQSFRVLVSLLVSLSVTSWIVQPIVARANPHHIIQGEAIIRGDRGTPFPGGPGTSIYDWFRIRPSSRSDVRVRCAYGSPMRLPDREVPVSEICSPRMGTSPNPDGIRGAILLPILGGNDNSIPYVVGPRRTFVTLQDLKNSNPILRWNHVEDAETYTVSLISSTVDNPVTWEITVSNINLVQFGNISQVEIPFPSEGLSLNENELYIVVVTANTGASSQQECAFSLESCLQTPFRDFPRDVSTVFAYSQDNVAGWGFEVLSEEKSQRLQTELDQLESLINRDRVQGVQWTEEAQTLARVHLYEQYELYSTAVQILQDSIEDNVESSALYIKLGDLYGRSGLNLLAQSSYQQALDMATTTSVTGLHDRALSQAALALLSETIGNLGNFTNYSNQARQTCQQINHLQNITPQSENYEAGITCVYPDIEARLRRLGQIELPGATN